MSFSPRWTVWASTDHGDIPRSTSDPAMLATLISEAGRSALTGTITVDDHGIEVARGESDSDDDIAAYLAGLTV